jgi:hypothetical protein
MAKTSGITTSVTVAGQDISNDILSFTANTPYGTQDVTGLDKAAMEKIMLRADCTGTLTFAFNIAANRSHAILKTPGSKTFVIVYPGPATLTFTAVTTDYSLAMGADGSLVGTAPWELSSGTAAAWT